MVVQRSRMLIMEKDKVHSIPNKRYYYYLFFFASSILLIILLRVGYLYSNPSLLNYAMRQPNDDKLEPCVNEVWCAVQIPHHSYFRFDTPITSPNRWRIAQNQAARGDPVLLRRILSHFPNYLNFLDGDVSFRSTHEIVDYFFDHDHEFEYLLLNNSETKDQYEASELPPVYHAETMNRAPIIMTGYHLFRREDATIPYFQGKKIKEMIIGRGKILDSFEKNAKKIHYPFLLMSIFNENWGMFSTLFPNRTTDWGYCCNPREMKRFMNLLNDPHLLAFFVNQHYNFTHPKVLALPRGLPIHDDNSKQLIWDTMRLKANEQKSSLFFTASSNWKYRPKIKQCIAKKFVGKTFPNEEISFLGYNETTIGRITPAEYYQRLASARMCIALPGLGYDTFRLWESLTFGVVPVLEKGVGLDKTLWRLPALLVEDYDQVTPELLRSAYVEALYRVNEFEFERLTQDFWWTLIMNISTTKSTKALLEKFPVESEDPFFARPMVPFTCSRWSACKLDTKRTPAKSC